MLAASVVACTPRPEGPGEAAQAFVDAFARHDVDAAAALTDQPAGARPALARAWDGLQALHLDGSTQTARFSGDAGSVEYRYAWHLPHGSVWTYTGQLKMGRRDGVWSVRWAASNIHPQLGDDQTLALRTTPAPQARVNIHNGGDVLVPGLRHAVLLDSAALAGSGISVVADQLTGILSRFDPTLNAQEIAESATGKHGKYLVTLLHDEDFDQVAQQLSVLPGVGFQEQSDLVPVDPAFAPEALAHVRRTVLDDVAGKAGWSVVTLNPNGIETDVLTDSDTQAAPSYSLTLDRAVQNAAQRAVDIPTKPAVIVALQPSTGAILAIAQNHAADALGPLATSGRFPPGSTFKIVTAGAAIAEGLADPTTQVPCPGRIDIGERSIPNYNDFSLGTVPMATAFAKSCNTTFAKLASEMQPEALRTAAAQLGIVARYSVVGIPTTSAYVPAAPDLVVRTEDGFGQGRILTTPLTMAIAAATVAHGSTPPAPYLITGHPTEVQGDRPSVPAAVVDGLRGMMRKVVTEGTATRIADKGEVYGKTGEAEFPGGSHAWFVGYRGDLAFATLVVGGGGSEAAVSVTRDMFDALP